MDSKIKLEKSLWMAAVVIQILAIALGLLGTIFLFLDEYSYSGYYYENPIAGIMPLFGTFFTILGLIFLIVSKKGKKNLAIATMIFVIYTWLLYFYNTYILGGNYFGINGFNITVRVASPLLFLNFSVILAYLVVSKLDFSSFVGTKKSLNTEEHTKRIEELSKLKSLLDEQIITEEEFNAEKQKIMNSVLN